MLATQMSPTYNSKVNRVEDTQNQLGFCNTDYAQNAPQ